MITIEEKMKLFTKIVYDKVEKYNQSEVANFNSEYGNMIEERKSEFIKEAERIYALGTKDIQKEKLQILSKARVEEKKIILNIRKIIFEEMLNALRSYAEEFVKTDEYKSIFISDLAKVLTEMKSSNEIELVITQIDSDIFSSEIHNLLKKRRVKLKYDDEITGGFIAIDRINNVRIDMCNN
jgi:vacuolar-type H+-ATPase subunit E/Vma4